MKDIWQSFNFQSDNNIWLKIKNNSGAITRAKTIHGTALHGTDSLPGLGQSSLGPERPVKI